MRNSERVPICEEAEMTTDTIQEGDKVLIQVDANGQVNVEGTVSHHPCATGDAWIIQREGWPCVYVQQYHAMWKVKT